MQQYRSIPWDIILCFGCSVIFYILFLYSGYLLRIIFGIPFLFLIPGYLFILSLFPSSRIDKRINLFERMVLSIVFSLAIVSLIGIGLNFTIFTLTLFWFATFLCGFNIFFSIIALFRWYQQKPSERFFITFKRKIKKVRKPFDTVLNIILFIVALSTFMVISVLTISSFMGLPERNELFTEFYVLGEQYNANYYFKNITTENPESIVIGISNFEQKTMQYTIEVWLINQSMDFEQRTNDNNTTYYEMYFLDKIEVLLPAYKLNIEDESESQWQYDYQVNISNLSGFYKLQFFLYTHSTDEYEKSFNYYHIADEKIQMAYRTVHIWIHLIDR